ncbi:MAG TPA: hypothetical protein VNT33_10470, partial [Telluria sp.]|nr:hypothetical protein [Telluria sp.]
MSLPSLTAQLRAAALMLASATACAADDVPSLNLSGFGTLGIAHSSERQADFSTSVLKSSGAGFSDAYSRHVDSRFGAQLDLALNRRVSAVLQMVSEQHLDGSYFPHVEWANVKLQATPDLALRVGRIALPIFLAADFRKVGYAYPWIRQPVEMYGAIPLASSDGADLTWRWDLGHARL